MFKRIFISMTALALLSAVLFSFLMLLSFSSSTEAEMRAQLETEASLMRGYSLEDIVSHSASYLHNRVTYIDQTGRVLYDNSHDEASMENHEERPEVSEAFHSGSGYSRRYSSTLHKKQLYFALLLDNGDVLRLSTAVTGAFSLLFNNLAVILLILVLLVLFTFLVSLFISRRIMRPINNIDLDNFRDFTYYNELSPFVERIKKQKTDIRNQSYRLASLDREYLGVLDSINEGLFILDEDNRIRSVNNAALAIFGQEASFVLDRHYLSLSRSVELNHVIEGAEKTAILEKNGKAYALSVHPVKESSRRVVVVRDVTEAFFAEKRRREFTANVSHELKTPITVIKGTAELLFSGLVKEEDRKGFYEKILTESDRLASLVSDIISLSSLEESSETTREKLNVLSVAKEVVESLYPLSEKSGVTLVATGEGFSVLMNEKQLFELISNLVGNAIRYNRENGSVSVSVEAGIVSVTDTGIGIPEEDIDRIFERFYRVDKSRSKNTGGTGLGLSIVKHIAQTNGIGVKVESRVGEGSVFTLDFSALRL
jgi:Signal transduction histidine kinase